MVKGFINYNGCKIPFVIEKYKMDLFTDDCALDSFIKEYNNKENYILYGIYFYSGNQSQEGIFYVEKTLGSTCYLKCYILYGVASKGVFDSIGIQSPTLDDVFRYRYVYLDKIREGINIESEPKDIYSFPFIMNNKDYKLSYRIGHNNKWGLLEDFDRKGEVLITLEECNIQECNSISTVMQRLAMFMSANSDLHITKIKLYKNGHPHSSFYSPIVQDDVISCRDTVFYDFDVMRYVPKILNNISKNANNEITHSIPLGHLGNFDSLFSPQRFIEQVVSFEYLFDKIDHKKAQDTKYPLKNELSQMINEFPQISKSQRHSVEKISETIKELRRKVAHGYSYYYDFNETHYARYIMMLLDTLIRNMSLLYIGFTKEEIEKYPSY